MDLAPPKASVLRDGKEVEVPTAEIVVDDTVVIRPGNKLPVDGTVLPCRHQWGEHEHPSLISPVHAKPGNGLPLFFCVDDFNETLLRSRAIVAGLEEDPHLNSGTGTSDFALRDPDEYYIVVSARCGLTVYLCGSRLAPSERRPAELNFRHR